MVLVTAFSIRLKEGEFIFYVLKKELKAMADMLFKATKYMNVEDALLARKNKKGKRKRESTEHTQPYIREKTSQYSGKKDNRKARPPSERIINSPLDQVLMQISDDPALSWPEKLKGDPDKRSKEKYYRFHHDHGHNTSECYKLKSQIEALIRKEKL